MSPQVTAVAVSGRHEGPHGRRVRGALALAALALSLGACTDRAKPSVLRLEFEPPAERGQVTEVVLRAFKGGCGGGPLRHHQPQLRPDDPIPVPDWLPPGRYGLEVEARNRRCEWFAKGCVEVDLPGAPGDVVVTLRDVARPAREPRCTPQQSGGPRPNVDAGYSSDEAGIEAASDATVPPPPLDAGAPADSGPPPPGGDGGPPASEGGTESPSSKCDGPRAGLVACFDFDGNLEDASGNSNHAAAEAPRFEPSPAGQALRPAGAAVAAPDTPSLDLTTALTVEVWFRADSLINLAREAGISLLVDNDEQYYLGFNPDGSLEATLLRRGRGADLWLRTQPLLLRAGRWAYVALTYDGQVARLYLDGALVLEVADEIELDTRNDNPLHIGSGSPNTTRPFDGLIDALRIWSVPRSEAEICAEASCL